MAPELIWKEMRERKRRKGTGNAVLLLAITVGSDGHRFDPRWVNLDDVISPERCRAPGNGPRVFL